jgi:hypothetical protein
MTRHSLVLMTAALMAGLFHANCFVNEGAECAGNQCSQDPGQDQQVDGNLLLTADGSLALTIRTTTREGVATRHLLGVRLPAGEVVEGPEVEQGLDASLMLGADSRTAYLVLSYNGIRAIRVLDLEQLRVTGSVPLEPGVFDNAILSPDGQWLALAAAWRDSAAVPVRLLRTGTWEAFDLAFSGTLYDVRFSRASDRLVALSDQRVAPEGGSLEYAPTAYDLRAWSLGQGTPATEPAARVEVPDFELNLLGYLTWSIRLSPDGRWAAVSGFRKTGEETVVDPETHQGEVRDVLEDATALIDLEQGTLFVTLRCNGPVGFTPDSGTVVGFRHEQDAQGQDRTLLVFTDLPALQETVSEVPFYFPVYYLTPAGDLVITFGLFEAAEDNHLVITSLATGETTTTSGPAVQMAEFAPRAGHEDVFIVDGGGLYRLDLGSAEVSEVRAPDYAADNLNLMPDGQGLLVSRLSTTVLDLWELDSLAVTLTVPLTE